MRKTHSSFRLVIVFLLVTVCIVFAACSCALEVDSPPVNPEIVVESVPTVSDTTVSSTTTETAVDEATTEALSTTSENTTAATTESKVEESTTRKTTTTAASTAKTTTSSASKSTTITTKQTTSTAKPTTTITKKTTTATTTTTTTKAPTTTTTTKATTTTTTKKASAVWGTSGEMKSDCISIARGLGYEYDSSLGKSNSHWITPTYSGAFTSSSALKAKIKDALQTYQTVGYTYCNFAFESNGEGEYYIYIFVG